MNAWPQDGGDRDRRDRDRRDDRGERGGRTDRRDDRGRGGDSRSGDRGGYQRGRDAGDRGGSRGGDQRGGYPRSGDQRGGYSRGGDQRGGDQRGGDRPYRPRRDDDRGGYRGGDQRGGDQRSGDRDARPRRFDDRPGGDRPNRGGYGDRGGWRDRGDRDQRDQRGDRGERGGRSYGDRGGYGDRPRRDDRGGAPDRGGSADRGGYRNRDDRGGYRGGQDRDRGGYRGGGRDDRRESGDRGASRSGDRSYGDRPRRYEGGSDRGRFDRDDRRPARDDRGDRGDRGRGSSDRGYGGRDQQRGDRGGGYRRPDDRGRGSSDRGGSDRGRFDRDRGDRRSSEHSDRRDRNDRSAQPWAQRRRDESESTAAAAAGTRDDAGASVEPQAPPPLPDDVVADDLDAAVRAELQSLARPVGETVARHLVAAGRLLDDDPATAFAHTLAARRSASRIAAVREAVGLAAYRAGEWQTAITELRTYHRLTGRHSHLAVLADSERALGRPERAVDLYRTTPREDLTPDEAVELLIVAAGARQDLGQAEAAVSMLQVRELAAEASTGYAPRLRYAFADALLAAGRPEEAREWFARAAAADEEGTTDAAERLLELDGVTLTQTEAPDSDDLGESGAPESGASAEPEPAEAVEPEEPLEPADAVAPESPVVLVAAGKPEAAEKPLESVAQLTWVEPAAPGEPPAAVAPEAPETSESPAPETAAPAPTGPLVAEYDLVVLDLDGVVYLGDEAVPGAVAALARLRRDGVPVAYATNNASRSAADVAAALRKLGVEADDDEVVTSAMAAAEALKERLAPGSAVLVVGTDALVAEVTRVGLRPVARAEDQPAAVVQGYGPEVGWRELAEAAVAVRSGAYWVATNTDRTLPTPRGPLPGNGSLVAVLRTALEREPDLVVGKPGPAVFTAAARRYAPDRVLVVGDRLDTDIAGARAAGMDSLLVLTGVDTAEQAQAAAAEARPTFVGADLEALFAPPQPI